MAQRGGKSSAKPVESRLLCTNSWLLKQYSVWKAPGLLHIYIYTYTYISISTQIGNSTQPQHIFFRKCESWDECYFVTNITLAVKFRWDTAKALKLMLSPFSLSCQVFIISAHNMRTLVPIHYTLGGIIIFALDTYFWHQSVDMRLCHFGTAQFQIESI